MVALPTSRQPAPGLLAAGDAVPKDGPDLERGKEALHRRMGAKTSAGRGWLPVGRCAANLSG